jgi:uncharacterized membrane protein
MSNWILASTTFLASAVEFIEAATIVLAVGFTQGWRAAIAGSAWAAAALIAIVALFGPWLTNAASVDRIELIVGPFLVLFGIAWLRKAVWRYAGRKAMRDEQANFDRDVARLRDDREHRLGFAVAFQGVLVEGLEVAVIVVTFAASARGAAVWPIGGALAALVVVTLAAIALRKPFARVPENAMKALVGIMLLSLGTFWTGEGLHIVWPAGDATLLALAGLYVVVAALLTLSLRARRGSYA